MKNNQFPQSHNNLVSRSQKEQLIQQNGKVLWFTGLSGAGKSTIATHLEQKLIKEGIVSKILDGDLLRTGLNSNLGFSEEDRIENIRRTAEVAKLFSEIGTCVIVALISPTQVGRDLARNIIGTEDFIEVFIDAPLEVCEKRDVKGLYKKVRNGEIENFTGISSPYEEPQKADIILQTDRENINNSVNYLFKFAVPRIYLSKTKDVSNNYQYHSYSDGVRKILTQNASNFVI